MLAMTVIVDELCSEQPEIRLIKNIYVEVSALVVRIFTLPYINPDSVTFCERL